VTWRVFAFYFCFVGLSTKHYGYMPTVTAPTPIDCPPALLPVGFFFIREYPEGLAPMNTCSNCALWGVADARSATHRACMSTKINDHDVYDEADTLVYPYAEGGLFRTGPAFGCVHHAAVIEKNQS
jgi:hypothetical protein